jgi:anthranilate phosphoribosyltransferase
MDAKSALEAAREPMDRRQAAEAMAVLVSEQTADEGVAGILTALAARPSTGTELAGYVDELRSRMVRIDLGSGLVDTCGTGGGRPTPNVSTVAALIAAAAGARVAKHGNRAVTSAVGSADVLEALGVRPSVDAPTKRRLIEEAGVCFLFAPDHHPALRRVGPVRRSLGFRTVFNLLGPLLNPAGARRQVTGVWDRALLAPMAEAMALTGSELGYAVWHTGGYDEAMPFGRTVACGAAADPLEEEWDPEFLGSAGLPEPHAHTAATPQEAAELARQALQDADSVPCRLSLPTAALALWVAGAAASAAEGHALAADAVRAGKAWDVLQKLISISNDP